MELDIHQVAAFTDAPFGGNPAAVVPLTSWIDDGLMQKIAAENNLSETAFLVPTGDSEWQIRWFTPAVEVPLCGHATLASAAVIRHRLAHEDWPITLRSASGPLIVYLDEDRFVLDLPSNPPREIPTPEPLVAAIGADPVETLMGGDIVLLVYEDQETIERLAPDFPGIAGETTHGVIVTAPGNDVDFVSRFFAPSLGIDEDPVTGAAHCVLTPYWSLRLGMDVMEAIQVSTRRGHLHCELAGDRVRLSGGAVFFLSGRLTI